MFSEALIWFVLVVACLGSLTVTKHLLTERRRNQLVFFSASAIALRELGDEITMPPLLQVQVAEGLKEPAALFIISTVFLTYSIRLFSEGISAIGRTAALSPQDNTFGSRVFTNIILAPFSLTIDVIGPLLITLLALNGDIIGTIEVWKEVYIYAVDALKQISEQETDEQTSSFIVTLIDEILRFLGTGIERVLGRFTQLPDQIRSLSAG